MARKKTSKTSAAESRELVLYAVSGADIDVGSVYPLPHDEPLQIGRSSKGLKLLDPLVSIQHARIEYDVQRGYVVFDLGSATGTWVDEECLKKESRPIGVGTRLRFGDTVFEVQTPSITPWWFKWFAAAVGASAVASALLFLAQGIGRPPPPELVWVDQGGVLVGGQRLTRLPVPPEFLRSRGLSLSDLSIESVQNYDEDGMEEMWLRTGEDRQTLVTFGPEGQWIELGDLPPGCASLDDGPQSFPTLRCGGTTWMFRDGRYRVEDQEGVVVWYRGDSTVTPATPAPAHGAKAGRPGAKAPAPAPSGPPPTVEMAGVRTIEVDPLKVGRFASKRGQHLGLFLSARGVYGPVHYLICESAFPGIKPQVLRADGVVQELSKGCINELRLASMDGATPYAFALTPEGREALIADVRTFYAGNPDGLFLPPERQELIDSLQADPGLYRGGVLLFADTQEDPTTQSFDETPDRGPNRPPMTIHALVERDARIPAAPPAMTATITREGVALLEPSKYLPEADACLKLRIQTREFQSYGIWSLLSRTFLTIDEVGCSDAPKRVAAVDYFPTARDFQVGNLELRVVLEGGPTAKGLEVTRARLAYRERQD